jgi:DNA invertase Pin-like site-specific DNA recombinase
VSTKALNPLRDESLSALAFVYDRHATLAREMLRLRLELCAEYAEKQGWAIGGWFVDEGDDALTCDRRPAFATMLNAVRNAGADVPRVVLVHDWYRFSRDNDARSQLTRRIIHLGATVETCNGQQRRADGTYATPGGQLTAPSH